MNRRLALGRAARRRLAVGLGAVLLLCLAVFVWQAWSAAHALSKVRDQGVQLTRELDSGQLQAATGTAEKLRDSAGSARSATGGPLWWVGSHLPLVGKDLSAVRTSAEVLDDIAGRSLPTLLGLAREVESGDLRPHQGRIDLAAVRRHTPALRKAADAVDPAAEKMAAITQSGLTFPFRQLVGDLQERVAGAKAAIDAAADAFEVMPTMLGADGPRDYLLLIQNPAEVRASGGLPGSWAVLHADKGRLSMGAQGDGADFATGGQPVGPTADESRLFGASLGTDPRDLTANPDFPRVAQMELALARAHGIHAQGVFSVDPVALSYVLRGTGPVPLNGGVQLSATNAIPYLLNTVYQTVQNAGAQNDFYAQAARRTFDALVSGQGNQLLAIRGVVTGALQRRVFAWSSIPEVHRVIERTDITGALPGDTGRTPQVGVFYNDGVAGKMEYYLRQRTTAQSLGCSAGVQRIKVTTTLRSTAPGDVSGLSIFVKGNGQYAVPGHILMQMYVYSPWHGSIESIRMSGKDVTATNGRQRGQEVGQVAVDLAPGQSRTVTSIVRSGPGQTGNVRVSSTPVLESIADPVTFASTCG